jgi:hypothetical protein
VLVLRPEAADDNAVVVLTFGVDVFVVIDGQSDMGDLLATEEDEVPGAHVGAFDGMIEKTVLLIGIAG